MSYTITTSDTIGAIAKALCAAQAAMPKLLVDGVNPHFRNKYATLGRVCDVCGPPLHDNGIAVVHSGCIIDGHPGVACLFLHESGEWIRGEMAMPCKDMTDPQKRVSSITYGRRCLMAAMCNVAPEDDDDGNVAAQPAPKQPDPEWVKVCKADKDLAANVKALKLSRNAVQAKWIECGEDADVFKAEIAELAELPM